MGHDLIPLSTALMLGALHALELDHMVAVTTFVSRRPTLAAATRFGFRWGLGHSLAVLVTGGVLLWTGARLPPEYEALGEGLVGLMLIGLGGWAIASARKLHLHRAEEHGGHAHLHLHPAIGPHGHPHGPEEVAAPREHDHGAVTLVGLLHGLAGTSAIVALVPVTLLDRTNLGLGYLLLFSLGVTAAMMLFAAVAALAMREVGARSLAWGRYIIRLVGLCALGVGAWWAWLAMSGG